MARRGDAKPAGWGRGGGRPCAARAPCGLDRGRTPRYCGTLVQPRSPSGPRSPSPGGRPGDRCCERGGRASSAQSLRLPAGVTATAANQRGPRGLGCEVRARGAEQGSGGGEGCWSCTPCLACEIRAQPTLLPLSREHVFVQCLSYPALGSTPFPQDPVYGSVLSL